MKILNRTWIKRAQLDQLKLELSRTRAQMAAALEFVKSITQGNLDTELARVDRNGEEGELSDSLVNMRNQMKFISAQENQRHWFTEGMAKFGEIMRQKNGSMSSLADHIIRELVKYMGANQGALYMINDKKPEDIFVQLIACYAYDRKKHIDLRIEMGEGLAGQVALEKSTRYMTSIPADYIKITSGLGEALPRNLLIVPFKLEDKVLGMVEIASFNLMQPYQIEFVERLGESIASTISSVKSSEKTNQLLHETQTQAEQMRAQEEEMRQNMEELTATQEEMQRILTEAQGQERYMNQLIDSSTDSILVIDSSYRVVSANKALKQTYGALGIDIIKGLDVSRLFDAVDWPKYKAYYDRTFAGETFQRTELFQSHGFELYFISQHAPIRNQNGDVTASAVFAKDVTELVAAQKTAERLVAEQQEKNEELKAQEEELRQNMEELSATQDEMQRIVHQMENRETYVKEIIDASADSIFTTDLQYKLISYNLKFASVFAARGVVVAKGMDLIEILQEHEPQAQIALYARVFSGESFEQTQTFTHEGVESHILISYSPLKDELGTINAAAIYAKDVTAMVNAQRQAEDMVKMMQRQNEAYRDQEEKLRQCLAELELMKHSGALKSSAADSKAAKSPMKRTVVQITKKAA